MELEEIQSLYDLADRTALVTSGAGILYVPGAGEILDRLKP